MNAAKAFFTLNHSNDPRWVLSTRMSSLSVQVRAIGVRKNGSFCRHSSCSFFVTLAQFCIHHHPTNPVLWVCEAQSDRPL